MLTNILTVALLAISALAHGDHDNQIPIQGPHKALWYNTLPGDGGTQVGQLDPRRVLGMDIDEYRPTLCSPASQPSVVCRTTLAWHLMM